MLRVVVTGGGGQLATAIERLSHMAKSEYVIRSVEELDICSPESVAQGLEGADIVVNCAAYTNVEGAEDNAVAAMTVNRDGVRNIAEICTACGIKMIHISTDFVFGGDSTRTTPYSEEDNPAPINIYGMTKYEGEREALRAPHAIVLRTSWLYAPWGNNFVNTILRRAKEGMALRVVDDQRGTPTSALGLAEAIIEIIESGAWRTMEGIYHYSDMGDCTWYEFAAEILRQADITADITPCRSSDWQSKAQRPHYSVMDKSRISTMGVATLRSWQERLHEVITYNIEL